MLKKGVLILVVLALLVASICEGASYYGDITIWVSSDGLVTIKGSTNHPSLLIQNSPDLTSKKGKYWTVNLTFPETFSDMIFTLNLPQGSAINYLHGPKNVRFEDTTTGIAIVGTVEDQPLALVVQYQIVPQTRSLWAPIMLVAAFLVVGLLFFRIKKRRSIPFDPGSLTERQLMIVNFIRKHGGAATQALLEKQGRMPKSSLSRNVESLVRRGIITKEQKGMTNYLRLK